MNTPTDFFDLFQPTPPAQSPVPVVPEVQPQPEGPAKVPSLFEGVLDDAFPEIIEAAPEVEAQDSGWADDSSDTPPLDEPEVLAADEPEDLAVHPEVVVPVVPEPVQALGHSAVAEAPALFVVEEIPVEQEPEPAPPIRTDVLLVPVRGARIPGRWIWGAVVVVTIAAAGAAIHIYSESPETVAPLPITEAPVIIPSPAAVPSPVDLPVEVSPEPPVVNAPPVEPTPKVEAGDLPKPVVSPASKPVTPKAEPKATPKPEPEREWQDDALDQLDDLEKRL
jgi:hypothetical protein